MIANVDIVKSFYENLGKGDVTALLGLMHDDLYWTEAEGFPYYGGTWRHPSEVLEKLFKPLARDWVGFQAAARDFILDDDRIVCLGAYSGIFKSTGNAMRAPFVHIWRVSDQKLARFEMYTDTFLVRKAMGR